MCTVTIHRKPGRLLVSMNRDERRARGPEIPPTRTEDRSAWLAPRDAQRGGTWIGVNAEGVVALLLNGYLPGDAAVSERVTTRTRGEIVATLMPLGSVGAMRAYLTTELEPAHYPSFTVVVAGAAGVESYYWDGLSSRLEQRVHTQEWTFFTSSSWNTEAVTRWREEAFQGWRDSGCATSNGLPSFHLLQPEGKTEWSPLMDRELTCTRSITQVEVAGDTAAMTYWPREAIDATREPTRTVLSLRAGSECESNV